MFGDIVAIMDTSGIFGTKWSLLIVHCLSVRESEVNTFKKIEKDIGGISARMLPKGPKVLERDKILAASSATRILGA